MISRFFRAIAALYMNAYREQALRDAFPDVTFSEGVIVKGMQGFHPGKGVFLDRRCYLNCTGGDWSGRKGYIILGENSEVGPYGTDGGRHQPC